MKEMLSQERLPFNIVLQKADLSLNDGSASFFFHNKSYVTVELLKETDSFFYRKGLPRSSRLLNWVMMYLNNDL